MTAIPAPWRFPWAKRATTLALTGLLSAALLQMSTDGVRRDSFAAQVTMGRLTLQAAGLSTAGLSARALAQASAGAALSWDTVHKLEWFLDPAGLFTDQASAIDTVRANALKPNDIYTNTFRLRGGILAPYRALVYNIAYVLIPIFLLLAIGTGYFLAPTGMGGGESPEEALVGTVFRTVVAVLLLATHVQYHVGVSSLTRGLIDTLENTVEPSALARISTRLNNSGDASVADAASRMSGFQSEANARAKSKGQVGLQGLNSQFSCLGKSTNALLDTGRVGGVGVVTGEGVKTICEQEDDVPSDASLYGAGIGNFFKTMLSGHPIDAVVDFLTRNILGVAMLAIMFLQMLFLWVNVLAIVVGIGISLTFAPLAMAMFIWPVTAQRTGGWFASHLKLLFRLPFLQIFVGLFSILMPVLYTQLEALGPMSAFVMFVGFTMLLLKGGDLAESFGTDASALVGTLGSAFFTMATTAAAVAVTGGLSAGAGAATGAKAAGDAAVKGASGGVGGFRGLMNIAGQGLGGAMRGFGSVGWQGLRGAATGGIGKGLLGRDVGDMARSFTEVSAFTAGSPSAMFQASQRLLDRAQQRRAERDKARAEQPPAAVSADDASGLVPTRGGWGPPAAVSTEGAAAPAAPAAAGAPSGLGVGAPVGLAPAGPTGTLRPTDRRLVPTEMLRGDGTPLYVPPQVAAGDADGEARSQALAIVADQLKAKGLGGFVSVRPPNERVPYHHLAVDETGEAQFASLVTPGSSSFDPDLFAAVQTIASHDDIGTLADPVTDIEYQNLSSIAGMVSPNTAALAGFFSKRVQARMQPRQVRLSDLATRSRDGASAVLAAHRATAMEDGELARRDQVGQMLKVDPDSGAGVMARHLHPSFTEDYGDPPQVLAARLAPLVDDTQVEQGLHEWMATTAAGETYQPVWNAAGPAQQRAIVQQVARVPGAHAQYPGLVEVLAKRAAATYVNGQFIRQNVATDPTGMHAGRFGLDVDAFVRSGGTSVSYVGTAGSRFETARAASPGLEAVQIEQQVRQSVEQAYPKKSAESAGAYRDRINVEMFIH